MARQHRGQVPAIDHKRITRATDERLRGFIPALNIPVEGANATLDKISGTLNRAGSSAANPILSGLGVRRTIILNSSDRLRSVHLFRDGASMGPNLIREAGSGGDGLRILDFVAGAGRTVSGNPSSGALKNFIRWVSTRGTIQKEFYVKSIDYDVVALNGLPALDPTTLLKVCIDVIQLDPGLPWIDVVIDFFVSWNDEFQVLHNAKNPHLDPGFLKSYGGSLFVSMFETGALEGQGTSVNPVTQEPIKDQHKVEVENTVGQKDFTCRFRSKKDSPYWVDVDVCVNVLALVCPPGNPPTTEDPPLEPPTTTIDYLPPQDPPITPTDIPCSDIGGGDIVPYSVEGIDPETWEDPVTTDIDVITVQGQTTGAVPKVVVLRYAVVGDLGSPGGIKYGLLSEKKYTPLVVSGATTPTLGSPFQAAQAYRISFRHGEEVLDQVVAYVVYLEDGSLKSAGATLPGPAIEMMAAFLQSATGRLDTTSPT